VGQWDNLREIPKLDVAGSIPVARSIFSSKPLACEADGPFSTVWQDATLQHFEGAA